MLTPPAAAQEATPTPTQAAPTAAGDDGTLGDIVVTAERRVARLQDVPVSVAVVPGETLTALQAGGGDILSLSNRVPGLYAETATGRIYPRFYIRGLGNPDFYLGASQPVSIIQDDVVMEHVVLKSNPLYDVAQIEVLRGPQGSLFGRNTTAGIIKVDTIRPTQAFAARADASYGSYGTAVFDGGVGGPIVPGLLAVRVSALYQHRDQWIDNVFAGPSDDGTETPKKDALGGFDERNARVQLLLTPGSGLSFLLSAHARDYDGASTVFPRGALVKGSNTSAAPRDRVSQDEAENNPQSYRTRGGSLTANWDAGVATLTSITAYETSAGYSRVDTDGGAAADFPVNGAPNGYSQSRGELRDLDQWTQELRLASNGARAVEWQLGGFLFDSRDTTDFYQRAYFLKTAANNLNNWVRLRNVNTSAALFGQVGWHATERLTLTAGARQTRDVKRTRLVKTADTIAGVSTYAGRRDVRLADTQPSWDLSALYQATPGIGVYARVARGFRGPTIQGRSAVFNSDFTTATSETILSYEAGVKSVLLGDTLRVNATAFAYTVSDIQLNGNDANGNGVLFNADQARAYGIEADLTWRPTPALTLTLGGSALHTEIRDRRVYAQVCALNGIVVCTVKDPTIRIGSATFAQIDGNPLPHAPSYQLTATARYERALGNGGRAFVVTDWTLQGRTSFVLYETREFYANGNVEGGAKLGYALPGGRYDVALFARNITDAKSLKGVVDNYMAAIFTDPRVIGVSVGARWK